MRSRGSAVSLSYCKKGDAIVNARVAPPTGSQIKSISPVCCMIINTFSFEKENHKRPILGPKESSVVYRTRYSTELHENKNRPIQSWGMRLRGWLSSRRGRAARKV